MLFKLTIAIIFILIAISLAAGLFFLMTGERGKDHLVTSLTFRVSLSIILFILLIVGFKFGWIEPHGLGR